MTNDLISREALEDLQEPAYSENHYIIDRVVSINAIRRLPTINAVVIPDNATNGDMIKALFPNVPVDKFFQDTISFYPLMPNGLTDEVHFDECWWNAPYKREGDEE